MTKVKLSPSSIQSFFDSRCPAAWNYSRQLEPLVEDEWLSRGTLVHSMMAGDTDPTSVTDNLAQIFYKKLLEEQRKQGITVLKSEVWRVIELTKHIQLRMRIDAFALRRNKEVVVDWKTAGAPWKVVEGKEQYVAPSAVSFQAVAYVAEGDEASWPQEMMFIVAPARGKPSTFFYYRNKADYENLVNAANLVREAIRSNNFPKIRGYACHECKFKAVCYEAFDWESKYKSRTKTDPK